MTVDDSKIRVKLLSSSSIMPEKYGAGYLLFANEDYVLKPGCKYLMPTGISMAIPTDYYGQMHLLNQHVGILKLLGGVIDSDYRGQVNGIMYNMSKEDFIIKKGDTLCLIIYVKINTENVVNVSELSKSARGDSGFGSTGK